MIRRLLKGLLPRGMREALGSIPRYREARRLDAALRSSSQDLRGDLLSGLRILSDRGALLDVLAKQGVVAEIGVSEGGYAEMILSRNSPRVLHLIDPWNERDEDPRYNGAAFEKVKTRFAREIAEGRVVLHRELSWVQLPRFEKALFDWVYIDAAHDYESVRRDLAAVRTKVRDGGFICGDDYATWCGPLERMGVVEAVNEFCNTYDYEMVFLTHQSDRCLSYALRKKA